MDFESILVLFLAKDDFTLFGEALVLAFSGALLDGFAFFF